MTLMEQIARLLFQAMNTRDAAALEPRLAPDAVFDFPGPGAIEGPRRILAFFRVLFRRYARLTFTIDAIIEQGCSACIVWSNQGLEADGRPYANRGVTVLKITPEGMIRSISDYFKDTSFIEEAR